MSVHLAPIGNAFQFLDTNGRVLTAGKLYTYQAGTSTPAATYTTSVGNVANTNPIVLNSDGRTPQEIWITDGSAYKFVLQDANGNTLGTYDNLTGIGDVSVVTAALTAFETALASEINPTGASLVGFVQPAVIGAVGETVQAKLAQVISVKDFGAVGDGVTDDTAAIQAAINYAIYQDSSAQHSLGKVFVPQGIYKTSDTIQLGYGTSFSSCILEGEGQRYGGGTAFCGTAIVPTFNDRPCIAIQGGRDSMVRNMSLIGKMVSYVTSNNLGTLGGSGGIDDTVAANWVDPAFPVAASTQYAPYVGIAIDPYAGAQPGTHYPAVTYPVFLGAVSQYNKSFSSNCAFENVEIAGFVVGVAVQPCDANGNGDYTKLQRCRLTQCQVALAIGNAQSRLVHVNDSTIVQCHTGISTVSYGQKNGKPTILVTSTEFGLIIYWLNCTNLAFGGGPRFIDCYSEVAWAIGLIGGNSGAYTVSFESCEFNFESRQARGQPQYTLSNVGPGMVSFDGCAFQDSSASGLALHFGGLASQYVFRACNNLMPATATSLYQKFALNATAGITFDQLSTAGADIQVYTGSCWNLTSGANIQRYFFSPRDGGTRDTLLFVYARNVCEAGSYGNPGVGWTVAQNVLGKGALVFVTAGTDVSFDTGLAIENIVAFGFEVGDCVWDDVSRTLFYVHARTGSSIVMRAQTNTTAAGALRIAMTNGGALYAMNCRSYTTSTFLQGDTTAASANVVNLGRDDGGGFTSTDIAVNDYVAVYAGVYNILPTAAAGNKVTARDGAARTLSTNGNFNYTATKVRFPVFWRAAPPNV